MTVADTINNEIRAADERYGPFKSTHEGLGVLEEEMLELKGAIHANNRQAIHKESCQVAAVATRLACSLEDAKCRLRSGL